MKLVTFCLFDHLLIVLCFDVCLVCVCDRVDGVMDAQGFERSYTVNSSILLAIEPHLIHFQQLLLEPPKVHKKFPTHDVTF